LFADAVSTKKLERLRPVLPRLFGLKANRIETEALTGIAVSGEAGLLTAARKLHGMGVRYVLVTLGAQGAFASDGTGHALMAPFPPPIRNATGCGDAFTAAAITAIRISGPCATCSRAGWRPRTSAGRVRKRFPTG
jgi:pseudouridine kinase